MPIPSIWRSIARIGSLHSSTRHAFLPGAGFATLVVVVESRTDTEVADGQSRYIIKPVRKALEVLSFVADCDHELSLSEICSATKLPKSTVFRYVRTLAADGFLRHDVARDRYGLGSRLWELGQRARSRQSIRQVALPLMDELRDLFDETVNLAILDGTEVVYVDLRESRQGLRMQTTLGGRDPAYATSLGKAMLAHLPDDELVWHVPRRMEPRTARTHTTLAALRRDLSGTRACGFAHDDGENDEGVSCFGAAILDASGRPAAALSVSAPTSRVTAELKDEIAAALTERARAVSLRLGWTPPPDLAADGAR